MNLESKIESLLFFKGEPMAFWDIAVALRVDPSEIPPAIASLEVSLAGRGIKLVTHDEKVMLGTTPEMSEFFETLRKEELSKELSKAALETLSIVLYRDSVTRSEINFIRGVNSGFILRALEVRGLVEREVHKSDSRTYVYKPTLELLSFMGAGSVGDLPQFEEMKKTLEEKLLKQTDQDEA